MKTKVLAGRPIDSVCFLFNTSSNDAVSIEIIQGVSGRKVIVSIILINNVYMHVCPFPNGFRDRAISLYSRATRLVLTRVAKCIDVDGGIFENVLC
jgi:hypothetical protein